MKELKPNQAERHAFAQRLICALARAGFDNASPAAVAREYNLRYPANAVTLHAVRKWIIGEAIPTQDRLVLLAKWLGVRPDWLRFGGPAIAETLSLSSGELINGELVSLSQDLARLSVEQRQAVAALVAILLKAGSANVSGESPAMASAPAAGPEERVAVAAASVPRKRRTPAG